MKVLYLTTVLPNNRQTGGEIVTQFFIDAIEKSGYEISVIGYQRKKVPYSLNVNEISLGERYIEVDRSGLDALVWLGLSFSEGIPYSAAKYYSKGYLKRVSEILCQEKYDICVIDHAQLAWLAPEVIDKGKLIFFAHNIENKIYQENSEDGTGNFILRKIYSRESSLMRLTEEQLASSAAEVWTIAPADEAYFSEVTKKSNVRLFQMPSHINLSADETFSKAYDVGLIGTWTWKANLEGLKWFFQMVYPDLEEDLSIQVAGRGAEWLEHKYPNVKYCGFVPDATKFMSQAKVIAIPAVSGGGLQIKTLDAIASGSLIVATPLALRGIANYPSCVSVAESPKSFADSIMNLVSSFAETGSQDHAGKQREALKWSKARHDSFFLDVSKALRALSE